MKDKKTSKPAAKKAKIEIKPSKQKPSKMKTEKEPKKSAKRQNSGSNSPASGQTRNTATVRVNGPKSRTPKTSVARSGLSNSAPPSKSVRWPTALAKKCERLLKELMTHEDSWPFSTPVNDLEVCYALCLKTTLALPVQYISKHVFYQSKVIVLITEMVFGNFQKFWSDLR